MEDHYAVLGILPTATKEEIKHAWKKFAKQHHPDVNGNRDASAKFKQGRRAYDVLSDDRKRSEYIKQMYQKSEPNKTSHVAMKNTETPKTHITVYDLSVKQLEKYIWVILLMTNLNFPTKYVFTTINELRKNSGVKVSNLVYYLGVLYDTWHFFTGWLFSSDPNKSFKYTFFTTLALIFYAVCPISSPAFHRIFIYSVICLVCSRIAYKSMMAANKAVRKLVRCYLT